ncbi:GntR family transcriptional regulator [Marivita geojedonensis]|uniref:GntR family transcriptional regulator n=1 Tax=Marivita geojedonensis TaxID=1123756 RepID=A0A1X4NNI4_9RHOB|nr:GntR family transcriptional regulator [Marivita geojedonensis]OSQ51955.1 GntR family transcriptional regulator [Marivita geojedonensis]PRY81306.1 GntR family transcriptional regulator [Marivita geojedonensis]
MSDRKTQFDKALLGLRSLVMSGEFAASARLPEVALAERLGISRTPLRQAMDRLVAEGLLERIETGGCRAARFTLDDINDAIELRGVIEGTAARLAAERGADPVKLEEARYVLEAIDGALMQPDNIDFDAYVHENARFHALLAGMSGSQIIEREVARISQLPLASPSAFLREQELIPDFSASLVIAQGQHRAILEAIVAREGARAEALSREHARLARRNLDYLANAGPGVATRVPGLSLLSAE